MSAIIVLLATPIKIVKNRTQRIKADEATRIESLQVPPSLPYPLMVYVQYSTRMG